jgi:hypothetical protein
MLPMVPVARLILHPVVLRMQLDIEGEVLEILAASDHLKGSPTCPGWVCSKASEIGD